MTITVTAGMQEGFDVVLSPGALDFLEDLHRRFEPQRTQLLQARAARVRDLAEGATLDFLQETEHIRADSAWRVAPPAPGLVDRRVEITGPTDRKMTINALNSGANTWLADFEDANTPLWENIIGGQLNLRDAIRDDLEFTSPEGKQYKLDPERDRPTIIVRPRGWHLPEKHIVVDDAPIAGGLVDFGLYLAHNGAELLARGSGPYYYLPKLESHLEARLWNDVFTYAEERYGLPLGSIRATVLIETFPAAFEMDEILYELRDHSAGLNAGRWDYMFSIIKSFRTRGREFLLPDRNSVTMTVPFMRAYTELLVATCHRRGAHAIGGMAAFIPSRDPDANHTAFMKVLDDKTREATDGFDGSWVAHPGMVELCKQVFDEVLGDKPHQLDRKRDEVEVTASQLLDVASTPGTVTEAGVRTNVSVGIQYIESWLRGIGAVAINNLMEDAATAEICRSQLWQWLHNDVELDDGRLVTKSLIEQIVDEELAALRKRFGGEAFAAGVWDQARATFTEATLADVYVDFLTLPAYERMP